MTRPPIKNCVAMVTGASSGIGREIARELAEDARVLVLVARRQERLEALKEELGQSHPELEVIVATCDLTAPSNIDAMLSEVHEKIGHIDILINNAGLGDVALFHRTTWEKLHWMLQVNVVALTYLSHRLVQPMIAKKRGGILNISSGFAFTFMPGFAAYSATKMYVTGLTEALRLELIGTGVSLTQICPGPVATEFEAVAGNPLGQSVPSWIEMSPERCARISVRAFRRGRTLVIPGFLMKVTMGLARITPRPILRFVYRFVARTFWKAEERDQKVETAS